MPILAFIFSILISASSWAIIDGRRATTNGQFHKRTVMIVTYKSGQDLPSSCTGVIVAEDLILTAAHCVPREEYLSSTLVLFGVEPLNTNYQLKANTQWRAVIDYVSLEKYGAIRHSQMSQQAELAGFTRDVHEFHSTGFIENLLALFRPGKKHKEFFNYADYADGNIMAKDLALLKMNDGVPKGYEVSRFYTGRVRLNQKLLAAGYGFSSLITKSFGALRWSIQKLFGYHKEDGSIPMYWGVQNIGLSGQVCNRDSGGPLFITNNNQLYLLGITGFVITECDYGHTWYVNPNYFKAELRRAARQLQSNLSI